MTERSTFDGFEQRVADALERYVAGATDPRPAADIASLAMQPRSLVIRARNASRRRRIVLVGLAATLLVPAAYLGAGGLRSPEPDRATTILPSPTVFVRPTAAPITGPSAFDAVFVRRHDGPEPGLSIVAVRSNGDGAVIRTLNDSVLTAPGKFSEWGAVSESGWIALAVQNLDGAWPMVLVDLRDPASEPWLIEEANIGGVGPRWGPTGLVAAPGPGGIGEGGVVVVDPETHTTRLMAMQGRGLIAGGPSIVWAADGSGIAGSNGRGGFDIVPLDGSAPRPGVGPVFDVRGAFGPGLATLRTCDAGAGCPGGADGRVDLTAPDGSSEGTIWRQVGVDRALAAGFGRRDGEYWLSLDHNRGRQVSLVHVLEDREETIGIFNRDPAWDHVGAPVGAPDDSTVGVTMILNDTLVSVVMPRDGTSPSLHGAHFAGFVERAAAPLFATGRYEAPAEAMPPIGSLYPMPPIGQLIATELTRNPGRRVLASGSHDAIEGATVVRDVALTRNDLGAGEGYLDCFGPASATVTTSTGVTTNPCLRFGSHMFTVDASGPITVTASDDTTWRVVVYSP